MIATRTLCERFASINTWVSAPPGGRGPSRQEPANPGRVEDDVVARPSPACERAPHASLTVIGARATSESTLPIELLQPRREVERRLEPEVATGPRYVGCGVPSIPDLPGPVVAFDGRSQCFSSS